MAGLPEPAIQHSIRDARGRERYRLDLAYPEAKIAIEYDGRHHIQREEQWTADLSRREELEADGWRILIVTGSDYYRTPDDIVKRVREALRARGVPTRSPGRRLNSVNGSAHALRSA